MSKASAKTFCEDKQPSGGSSQIITPARGKGVGWLEIYYLDIRGSWWQKDKQESKFHKSFQEELSFLVFFHEGRGQQCHVALGEEGTKAGSGHHPFPFSTSLPLGLKWELTGASLLMTEK